MTPTKDSQKPTRRRDFRLFLQQELLRRCEKNPSYSLRSYAQQLGVHHGSLSQMLAGKRKVSPKAMTQLALKIGLSPQDIEEFLASQKTVGKRTAKTAGAISLQIEELTQDTFLSISEWYHDAILEMTHLKGFQPDPKSIARALGLTVTEVHSAVERLQRLRLLRIDAKSRWVDVSRHNTTELDLNFSSVALRKYQKSILELSQKALTEVDRSERDHTSTMMVIRRSDLPEVKNRIREFRHSLADFLQRSAKSEPDALYALAVSFFPILNKEPDHDKI